MLPPASTTDSPADASPTDARAIWNAGVQAVLGDVAVAQHVALTTDGLQIGDTLLPRRELDRVLVVGGGKATAAMAAGWLRALGEALPVSGWINVPAGAASGLELGDIHVCEARPIGVNEPTELAVHGTLQILAAVAAASPRELCVVLLSGGGSALLVAPAPGISLADKLAVTRRLSERGATITQLNTVRKHLSRVKGDRLRRRSHAGQLVTLVLSDVLGDSLDMIASGPTTPDTTTAADALMVLRQFDPQQTLPASIYRCLAQPAPPPHPQPPGPPPGKATALVIANNQAAVAAAAAHASSLGYTLGPPPGGAPQGSAEAVGQQLARAAVSMLRSRHDGRSQPACLVSGGEPVVQLVPAEVRGKGGRNQQLVLAAMVALGQDPRFTRADRSRLVLLSGGTDGEDGPTDAAGAILCEAVWQACEQQGLEPQAYLQRNDAYTFFEKTGGLLITGPTGTNVCDLRVITVRP